MSQARWSGAAGTAPGRAPGTRPVPERAVPLRLVPDAAPRFRRRAVTRACTALAVVMSGVGLFFVVFLHVLLTQGQADLERLQSRSDAESARNRRLRVAVAELESPGRIVGVARQRLGMVPPDTVTYLQAADPAVPLPPVPAGPPPGAPATALAPAPTSGSRTKPTTAPARTTAPATRNTTATTAAARRTTATTKAASPPTTAGPVRATAGARP